MRNVVALDIGGTNIRAALINEKMEIVRVIRKSTITGDTSLFLQQVKNIISDLNIKNDNVQCITMGVPGRVRWDGYIDALPNVGISNVPLAEYVTQAFGIPSYVKNDADMAGLAEGVLGAGKDYNSTFFFTISTGIGGAFIRNKQLTPASGEIGHTLFTYQGKDYEIEKLASGTGIVNLAELNGVNIDQAWDMFEMHRNKDSRIDKTFSDWLELLTKLFTFVQDTFQPEIIVLTGGVMKSWYEFFSSLTALNPKSHIERAKFDQDAGLIGAACYAFSTLKK